MAEPHVCRCMGQNCAPDAFPTGPRQNEGHMALRFGDEWRPEYRDIDVFVNGEPERFAIEVYPGRDGYVVRESLAHRGDPPNSGGYCLNCLQGLCLEVVRGEVRVRSKVAANG